MAFMTLFTAQNEQVSPLKMWSTICSYYLGQMYTVSPASGRIESGGCLKIQGEHYSLSDYTSGQESDTYVTTVLRQLADMEPPAQEVCTDALSFLGTVIHPDQTDLDLVDIVRIHWPLLLSYRL